MIRRHVFNGSRQSFTISILFCNLQLQPYFAFLTLLCMSWKARTSAGIAGGENVEEDREPIHRLCPTYAQDINSPLRHVRTRIYFTSESHVHSLINVLRFCQLGELLITFLDRRPHWTDQCRFKWDCKTYAVCRYTIHWLHNPRSWAYSEEHSILNKKLWVIAEKQRLHHHYHRVLPLHQGQNSSYSSSRW